MTPEATKAAEEFLVRVARDAFDAGAIAEGQGLDPDKEREIYISSVFGSAWAALDDEAKTFLAEREARSIVSLLERLRAAEARVVELEAAVGRRSETDQIA